MKKVILYIILSILVLVVGYFIYNKSKSSIPEKAEVVKDFKVKSYLGHWYEIARLDFKFQKDLDNCSAFYTLNDDGSVNVLNSGYNTVKNEWTKAEGKAKFRGAQDVGALEVSFFGPFYAGYNVVAIDNDYQYVLVCGRNLDFMWLLSRTKEMPEEIKNEYLEIARKIGYDTSKLVWAQQDRDDNPFLK